MPDNTLLRVPTRCFAAWAEVSLSIKMRLTKRTHVPMEEIGPALVFQELMRIALYHIHHDGYPEPGDVELRDEVRRQQLREMADMAEMIEAQGKRIAALEGREDDS